MDVDYFASSAAGDPWVSVMLRILFFVLAVYFCWTLYARRSHLEAVFACVWRNGLDLGRRIWARWGDLLKSRAVWGGLVVFITWRSQVTMPPEAQNFLTDILYALSGTAGLVLVAIGRIFAAGPLVARMHRTQAEPLTNHGNAEAANDGHSAAAFRDFLNAEKAARPQTQVIGIFDLPPHDPHNVTAADVERRLDALGQKAPKARQPYRTRKRGGKPAKAKARAR